MPQERPPELLRSTQGTWPVTGYAALGPTRQALTALCVRDPPLVMPSAYPLLAAPVRRLEVVFTELAGNALRHGRQPVRAWLRSTARAWLIGIDDGAPDLRPTVGSLDTDQIGGRGLAIVLSLTSGAGWYVDGGVKTVWAEVPDSPPDELLQLLQQPRSGLSRSGSDPRPEHDVL
ncbi:ATP-binding protein [Kineosporia sp. NBRC 101731]|uniref:ATP-binding protein n=1 Tax=Kineosporia sp. NBRC 101731 TaxID=3032199 RepID=UPI0024A281F6|nr:ATP-binding protein [Kineosporia sp. NBRC 101731]GLY28751.1 hypothetical protein Kisp02_21160 [Kineosporia sp. NBRC 101731]